MVLKSGRIIKCGLSHTQSPQSGREELKLRKHWTWSMFLFSCSEVYTCSLSYDISSFSHIHLTYPHTAVLKSNITERFKHFLTTWKLSTHNLVKVCGSISGTVVNPAALQENSRRSKVHLHCCSSMGHTVSWWFWGFACERAVLTWFTSEMRKSFAMRVGKRMLKKFSTRLWTRV